MCKNCLQPGKLFFPRSVFMLIVDIYIYFSTYFQVGINYKRFSQDMTKSTKQPVTKFGYLEDIKWYEDKNTLYL